MNGALTYAVARGAPGRAARGRRAQPAGAARAAPPATPAAAAAPRAGAPCLCLSSRTRAVDNGARAACIEPDFRRPGRAAGHVRPGAGARAPQGEPTALLVGRRLGRRQEPPGRRVRRARPRRRCARADRRLRRARRGRAALRADRRCAARPAARARHRGAGRAGGRRAAPSSAGCCPRRASPPRRRADDGVRPGAAVRGAARAARPARRAGAARARDRGPPLGRPLDARLPLLPAARRARASGSPLVATYRSDELHRRHPLRPFLAELERLERVAARRAAAVLAARAGRPADRHPRLAPRPRRSPTRCSRAPAGNAVLRRGAAGGHRGRRTATCSPRRCATR